MVRAGGDAGLSAYAELYGKVQRKLFAEVAAGRSGAPLKNAYLERYGIPARMFNAGHHWLDDLISRTAKEPNRRKRRQMRSAQARMRQRITNLVDELHWQLVRWLTSNYQIILLPTFETQDMTQRAGRKIRSKTARMMLTFRHYEFKQRLKWKAWQRGALVLDVDEAYTSKTRSWDGTVNTKLGGAKAIRDDTGFGMDRDVNGARGIFLRALGDSPFLRGLLTQVASQTSFAS